MRERSPPRLAAALAGALALAAIPALAEGRGFTILQVNDTYKIEGLEAGGIGGIARLRTLRRQVEAAGRDVLVLHAGDLLFPSVMSKYLGGAAMVDALNRLDGSDAFDDRLFATFGNHEFDPKTAETLFERLAESRFSWLSADTGFRLAGMDAPVPLAGHAPRVAATALVEVGGIRVGLFGLTLAGDPRPWASYSDLDSRIAAARAAVAELRSRGAETIVALTHQAIEDDLTLAERVPGIDWIAGGHEHVRVARRAGATGISKADADARTAVRIDVDEGEPGRFAWSSAWVPLDRSVEQDPGLLGVVASWLTRLAEKVRERSGRDLLEVVGTTEHALEGIEPVIRGRESALGDFLADVMRDRLGTDLAFVNAGQIRVNDDVPAGGALRVYELEGIFYYDSVAVAIELTGAELLELLRRSVSQAHLAHGRFLQVSGIRFRYHATAGEGDWVHTRVAAEEVEVRPRDGDRWQPLDLRRTYSAATVDWLAENGCRDGYPLFSAGCGGESPALLPRPQLSWRGITEEAIAALPERRITTAIDDRIVRVEDDN